MSNILSIAVSGLQTYQQAISTTGDNIANVNTDGYSRQVVSLVSRASTQLGTNYVGNGVDVGAIIRTTDQFAVTQVSDAQSLYSSQYQYYVNASELDQLLSSEETSVSSAIERFFSALNAADLQPTDPSSRQALLSQSQQLVNRFQQMDTQLQNQVSEVNQQVLAITATINSLSSSIADINQQVAGNQNAPPELLDQRDNLVQQLSSYVSVQAVVQNDGSMTVSVGNGISLVSGGQSSALSAAPSLDDPTLIGVSVNFSGGSYSITNQVTGGQLGGLLSYRSGLLTDTRNQLNQIALVMSDAINAQHQLGMDLNGSLGQTYFSDINSTFLQQSRVVANASNQGTLAMTATISNTNQLTSSDYQLLVSSGGSGNTYQLIRLSDNAVTTISSFPTEVDGVTIAVTSGTAKPGDNFLISPTRNAISQMGLNVQTINQLALASPVRIQSNSSNSGSCGVVNSQVIDATNASFSQPGTLTPPLQIQFLSPTSYQIVNASNSSVIEGPIAFDPNNNNSVFPTPGSYDPGYRITLDGAPNTGDAFSITYNTGGVGDNRNGNFISGLQTTNTMDNNSMNFLSAYGSIVASVGTYTYQANVNQNASEIFLQQAEAYLDNIAGVNLDEEAANLLKYEQAYQASAQVISIASRMFDDLLSIFR